MSGVLQSPRPLPRPAAAVEISGKNDEVAAILKGLQLDKQFFVAHTRKQPLQDLMPQPPRTMQDRAGARNSTEQVAYSGGNKKYTRSQSRKSMPTSPQAEDAVANKVADFDIYLNEALTPVLAQALDALTRQLARMDKQGDTLDPKVRARFNPLTFLAQQLLRGHPKCARTPRRQAVYKNFREWSDQERGRRELLRRKDVIHTCFNGFVLRGSVQKEDMHRVIDTIDDTMKLGGLLKHHKEVMKKFGERNKLMMKSSSSYGLASPTLVKKKTDFLEGASWTWGEFWYNFANVVMQHGIVPYSVIQKGVALKQQEVEDLAAAAEAERAAAEEALRREQEQQRLLASYKSLYEDMVSNEYLKAILEEGKMLTGDEVRATDLGFEFEVPPKGPHVTLLAKFLVLLGFEDNWKDDNEDEATQSIAPAGLFRADAKVVAQHQKEKKGPSKDSAAVEQPPSEADHRYWDVDLATTWTIMQKIQHAELVDGVVEREVLEKCIVPPESFLSLRGKVEYEFERQNEDADFGPADAYQDAGNAFAQAAVRKPTYEELCRKYGMTMSRIEWLHDLFESFLVPDHELDDNTPPPRCLYPDCPASISKEQMRALISEVEPGLSRGDFDARFSRIDKDDSGVIEFDEFIGWIHEDDVKIAGATARKMTLEELAVHYCEPLDIIQYLHKCFQDALPEEVEDDYPDEPAGLAKKEAKILIQDLTPGSSKEEFDIRFEIVDQHSRQHGHCDFDEFLEVLELDALPAELRDKFDA